MSSYPQPLATGHALAPYARSRRSLFRDTRGGILIFGVLLGLLLVLMLAQLLGKGHALVAWRAHQNAADAAAYTNAVWHAQGMNLLVSVNLLTVAVLGMLVALRVAVVAAALSIVVPTGTPPSDAAVQDSTMLENLERTLERGQQITDSALGVLAGLQTAQTRIAAYAPVLAAMQAQPHRGSAFEVHSLSSSLLPVPAVNSRPEFATERLAGDRSLPVQGALDATACDQAKVAWPEQLQRLPQAVLRTQGSPAAASANLERWGLRPSRAASWVQYVAGLVDSEAVAGRSALCGSQFLQALRRGVFRSKSVASEVAVSGASDSERQSDASARAWAVRLLQVLEGSGAGSAGPALWPGVAVWNLAQNGNVFLRSAAAVTWTASGRDPGSGALSNGRYSATESSNGGVALAQAEAYFDCAGDWQHCEPVAMWQPRWRARLRRAEPWGALLAELGLDGRFYASQQIGRQIQSLVAQSIVGTDAHAAELLWLHVRSSELPRVQDVLGVEHPEEARNPLRTFLKDHANEHALLY